MNFRESLYKSLINQMGDVSELQVARELKYVYKQPGTLKKILNEVMALKSKTGRDKKTKGPKKYTEKEQLKRRLKDHAVITERDKNEQPNIWNKRKF